jgi:DNA-directed RNA polymerase II subunit RPB1
MNMSYLETLVRNGPDIYPGAKILERKNGDNISLRYVDRDSISLNIGDVVHRHMLNGDPVLFNRQPTLHRMSMMCHSTVIMPEGDTFRMNVADTKPYNADFDGDEMNMHMPQDIESASELKNLAAVQWQIISPANNKTIVGIFQDSLLGAYQFTRPNITLTHREAMNMLMLYDKVDVSKIPNTERISSFELLTQIMPQMSLKYKTARFGDDDDYKTSNAVIEIDNGTFIRGQLDKGAFGDGARGLLQRVCNDFGNNNCADFVDNMQNIVTEYMKTSAYSVGISDLIADDDTNNAIAEVITAKKRDVQSLIDETHLGIFTNKTGKSDEEEFETQINNILRKVENEAGKIGRKSLSRDNRFVIMVNAGSKGSDLNISQMISCLGQQNVDGKRIPYGFEHRTLPHFNKFDDSPGARGFVESSFISGLSPEELFFHAMGGRVGLIDTAVKTSQTGYIQRRLVKGLEDLKVEYDMTVRNNKNKIIQYSYGDDGIDPIRVESQILPLVNMSIDEIYSHYQMPSDNIKDDVFTTSYTKPTLKRLKNQIPDTNKRCMEMIDMMIEYRDTIIKYVFKMRDDKKVNIPVAFQQIINNVRGQQYINVNSMVDITPLEALELIDNGYKRIQSFHYVKPTDLFKIMYYYYMTPKELLMVKRFNRNAVEILIEKIVLQYKRSIIAPGEMVGIIAAQSIGEPTTQMTLNTFHFAGVASKSNVTRGVPRIEEILSLSENPKNPSCTVFMHTDQEENQDNAQNIMNKIENTTLKSLVNSIKICFDPDDLNTLMTEDNELIAQFNVFENMLNTCGNTNKDESEKSNWIIRMELNAENMLDKNITIEDINFAIKNVYSDELDCLFSDYNSDNIVFRIRLNSVIKKIKDKNNNTKPLDQSNEIYLIQNFQNQLLNNMVLRGVKDIDRVIPRKITDSVIEKDGKYNRRDIWVLDTVGTNLLDLLSIDYVDTTRTITNDIQEIYRVLGIEAARQAIFDEISEVIEFDSTYINYHHLSLLCDRMACNDKMVSIFRHGINNDNIGPIAKASFEETPEMFLKAARHAELDPMRGVSANVMCGQEGYFGTSAFQVLLDLDKFTEISAENWSDDSSQKIIDEGFGDLAYNDDPCSISKLSVSNNIQNIITTNIGDDNDYDVGF